MAPCKHLRAHPLRHSANKVRPRYHSQSPESLFTHTPGLRVIIPRSPIQAKGLLLSSIRTNDPVIFMEPKVLYRAAVEQVPSSPYYLPLDKAEVLKPGSDVTIVSYGTPLYTCSAAIAAAEKDFGCSVELVDLRTIYPWDRETVLESVKKTGRAIVVHESMMNAGVGAEVAATIQEKAFLRLEAPVKRVTGWATHTGLIYEKFIVPDVASKCILWICILKLLIDQCRGLRRDKEDDRLLEQCEIIWRTFGDFCMPHRCSDLAIIPTTANHPSSRFLEDIRHIVRARVPAQSVLTAQSQSITIPSPHTTKNFHLHILWVSYQHSPG